MGETTFAKRMAEALGRSVDGACAARPRGAILAIGLGAGVLAGIGGVLAGAIGGGLGGGLGAAIGLLVASRLASRHEPPLAGQMALVLTAEGFELHALSAWGGASPKRMIAAAAYANVSAIETADVFPMSMRATISTREGDRLEIECGRRGVGAGREVLAALVDRSVRKGA